MFPEELSTQVLSLGATIDSYALSCGVTLHSNGSIDSFEVCPSRIRITRKLSYVQLDDIINAALEDLSSPSSSRGTSLDANLVEDISILNRWAKIRNQYRVQLGALDVFMRQKTELHLNVKKEKSSGSSLNALPRYQVTGYTVWTNGTSLSLVSEFMILMSDTIGLYCVSQKIPVLYKTQIPVAPITSEDAALQEGETPFIRTTRLIKAIKPAVDTLAPGLHISSGSHAYVQCTSPIRRYHDLYNHYRLKASMHAASMGEAWADRAEEEAGITSLDSMSSAEERQATLTAIKMVCTLFLPLPSYHHESVFR